MKRLNWLRVLSVGLVCLVVGSGCAATLSAPVTSADQVASALKKSPMKVGLYINNPTQQYSENPWGFGDINFGQYISNYAFQHFSDKFKLVKQLSQFPLDRKDGDNLDLVIAIDNPKAELPSEFISVDIKLKVSFVIHSPDGETLDRRQILSTANVVMGSLSPAANVAKAQEGAKAVSEDAVLQFLKYFSDEKEPFIIKRIVANKTEKKKVAAEIRKNLKPLNSKYRVVTDSKIREMPRKGSNVVKEIGMGGILQVIGKLPSGWLQVAKEGEPIGWVHGDSLKEEESVTPPASFPTASRDSTPPSITITSHRVSRDIKVVVNLSKTRIIGKATDPSGVAEVKVNGQTTSLEEDGRFTADVFLKVGDNKILITAMDVLENIGSKTFTIKRNPKTAMVKKAEVLGQQDFGRYYALIVGNNNYQHLPNLETPRNDAKEIEKVLRELYGFETEVLLDATRSDILRTLNKIRDRLEEVDSFMFYYAGHGEFDKSSDKAYWLPVDAQPNDDTNWILSERITSNIKRFASNHILIVADSCYSGTMTRSLNTKVAAKGARGKYIKKMLSKTSRTLMASGGNEPVTDTGGDAHSVFAQVLLNALKGAEEKVFTAEELFYSHIKESVGGRSDQTPEYSVIRNSGHAGGDFLFVRE